VIHGGSVTDGARQVIRRRETVTGRVGTVKTAPDKHITPDQLWHLMAGAGVTDPAQQQYLAVAMHQLGDILYYHDDPELAQTVVLRPEWVNEYISRVLDSHDIAASILDDGFNRTLDRYPGLEIKRLVPCPCQGTEQDPCTELFDYEDLQKRLARNPPRHEIECRKSGEFLDVPQLLLGLAPSERDTTRAGIERLTSMLDGIVVKMADQAEYTQRMFLKILRTTQEQQETRCPSIFSVVPVKSAFWPEAPLNCTCTAKNPEPGIRFPIRPGTTRSTSRPNGFATSPPTSSNCSPS
jgi:hypothetical protein